MYLVIVRVCGPQHGPPARRPKLDAREPHLFRPALEISSLTLGGADVSLVRKNGDQLFGLSMRLEIVKGSHFGANVLNIIFRMKRSTSSSLIAAKTRASVVESPLDPAHKAHYPAIGAL